MAKNLTFRQSTNYPSGKQTELTYDEANANIDGTMYYGGLWSSGTYTVNEVVEHHGAVWVAKQTTVLEPKLGTLPAEWSLLSPVPGRGSMEVAAPYVPPNTTIGPGWTPVLGFDNVYVPERGILFALALGEFNFQWPGLWQLTFTLILEHDETNQSRQIYVRLWDVTDAAEVARVPVFIARNQPGTNITLLFPAVITNELLNDTFRWEIGGGDNVTIVEVDAQAFDAIQFGPSL